VKEGFDDEETFNQKEFVGGRPAYPGEMAGIVGMCAPMMRVGVQDKLFVLMVG
jgi:hypothetical protein